MNQFACRTPKAQRRTWSGQRKNLEGRRMKFQRGLFCSASGNDTPGQDGKPHPIPEPIIFSKSKKMIY